MHHHYVLKYIYPGLYSRPSCCKKFSRERLGNRTGPAPPPTSPRKTHSCAQLSLFFPILKLVPLGGAGQDTRKHRLREGRPQGGARAGDRFPAHLARRKGGAFAGSGPPSEPRGRQPSSVLTELSGRRSSPGQRQPGPSVLPRCRSASGRSRPQPSGRPGLCPSGLSVPGACLLFWFLRPMSQFFLERAGGSHANLEPQTQYRQDSRWWDFTLVCSFFPYFDVLFEHFLSYSTLFYSINGCVLCLPPTPFFPIPERGARPPQRCAIFTAPPTQVHGGRPHPFRE